MSPPPAQAIPPPHSMDRPRSIVGEEPGSSPSDHSCCLSFPICEVEALGTCQGLSEDACQPLCPVSPHIGFSGQVRPHGSPQVPLGRKPWTDVYVSDRTAWACRGGGREGRGGRAGTRPEGDSPHTLSLQCITSSWPPPARTSTTMPSCRRSASPHSRWTWRPSVGRCGVTGARPSSESSVPTGGRDMAGGTLEPQGLVRVLHHSPG